MTETDRQVDALVDRAVKLVKVSYIIRAERCEYFKAYFATRNIGHVDFLAKNVLDTILKDTKDIISSDVYELVIDKLAVWFDLEYPGFLVDLDFPDAFMRPEISFGCFYEVETDLYTQAIPESVCDKDNLTEYVEGTILSVELKTCYAARLSAAGFTDCTEYVLFDDVKEAYEYLVAAYSNRDTEVMHYMNVETGTVAPAADWIYTDEEGQIVDAVAKGEVTPVVYCQTTKSWKEV